MHDPPRGAPRLSRDEFACLVERHQHPLHAYVAGLLGSAEQAFDLVQEAFCDAWRAAQRGAAPFTRGAPDDEVRRWLFRAASNDALSALRRRRLLRWESLDDIEEHALGVSGGFEERIAEGEALQAAMARLAPPDVACLLLRVVHGFSAAETGLILGASADNVNNRLARAKQRLRAAYDPRPREAQRPR